MMVHWNDLPRLIGWGGLFNRGSSGYDAVIPMLDEMLAGGFNVYRYQSCPEWVSNVPGQRCTSRIDHNVLEHLIDEAAKRGIYVLPCIAHNFPVAPFIDGFRDEWIAEYLSDLAQINALAKPNIIFDLANEYNGTQSNIIGHYNAMIAALRNAGYDQPIHASLWWGHNFRTVARSLNDPLNNFGLGMHPYAQTRYPASGCPYITYGGGGGNGWAIPCTKSFDDLIADSGAKSRIDNAFWNDQVVPTLEEGLHYMASEIGSGADYYYTHVGVAFPMYFIRKAQEQGNGKVHVIMHRWNGGRSRCNPSTQYGSGCEVDYDCYPYRAQQYWNLPFYEPGELPPPPICAEHLTQAECEAAGCFWWNDACHSTPTPPIPLLEITAPIFIGGVMYLVGGAK